MHAGRAISPRFTPLCSWSSCLGSYGTTGEWPSSTTPSFKGSELRTYRFRCPHPGHWAAVAPLPCLSHRDPKRPQVQGYPRSTGLEPKVEDSR